MIDVVIVSLSQFICVFLLFLSLLLSEVRHLDRVDKRVWIDLSRTHRTLLRELRNEFEWKRCSLQTAILQQHEAKQRRRREEYESEGDSDRGSKPSSGMSHLIIIPPMNMATNYLPELIRTPVFYDEIATPSTASPPLSSSFASSSSSMNRNSMGRNVSVRSGSGSPVSPNVQPGASSTSTTTSSTLSIHASPIGSAISTSTSNSATSRFDHNAAHVPSKHTRKNMFASETDDTTDAEAAKTMIASVTKNRGEGATTEEDKRSWNEQINAKMAARVKDKITKKQFSHTIKQEE